MNRWVHAEGWIVEWQPCSSKRLRVSTSSTGTNTFLRLENNKVWKINVTKVTHPTPYEVGPQLNYMLRYSVFIGSKIKGAILFKAVLIFRFGFNIRNMYVPYDREN
jgi:hypothetical protein